MSILQEHLQELEQTCYEGDKNKAFRHAAFQITTNFALSDSQVIEVTGIDGPGDLEIDGWYVDEDRQAVILFQSKGGTSRVNEAAVTKFWMAPENLLDENRVLQTACQSMNDLSQRVDDALRQEFTIELVLAANAGFTEGAKKFASGKDEADRTLSLLDNSRITSKCSLLLLEFRDLEERWEDFKARPTGKKIVVDIATKTEWIYEIDEPNARSVHVTLPASEVVRIFRHPDIGYRLFASNPRGPLANAKVNKSISETMATEDGRRNFHLLNNGLSATCEMFEVREGTLHVEDLQIVNGCQTTVTLHKAAKEEHLSETLINMKLAIADSSLATQIAIASNSQTALKARDYTSFERQQRELEEEFARLAQPWYYELKQGYWRFVLDDQQKAKFKTGNRKRHIEVQPLAQAALAFGGSPSVALDRVRYVFEEIRTPEERDTYDRAFPKNIKASQLLLPWKMLDQLQHQASRVPYSTSHLLWLIAGSLRDKYGVDEDAPLSPQRSLELASSIENWFPGLYTVANHSTNTTVTNALRGVEPGVGNREYFREQKGFSSRDSLKSQFDFDMQREKEVGRDPLAHLP